MAAEQDWAAYANQVNFAATDTILARTAAGAGVEVPASGLVQAYGGKGAIGTTNPAGYWSQANHFVVNGGGNGGMTIHATTNVRLAFVAAAGSTAGLFDGGLISYVHADNRFDFSVSGVTRFKLASTGAVTPGADNSQTLGSASLRWSVVYAGTSTINTSDERDKTWRGPISDNEYAAAIQIIDELGFYQWNDAVAEKGAEARLHFGARAQRVFAILDEHLGEGEWHHYAFACYDSWEDEFEPIYEERIVPAVLDAEGVEIEPERVEAVDTGETRKVLDAGDRYGIRPDQFTMFLLAAQARRQAEIEARLAAIEALLNEAAA